MASGIFIFPNGGSTDPTISSRITALENETIKRGYYQIVTGTSGSIATTSGITFVAGQFGSSGNSIISQINGSNYPIYISPTDVSGNPVTSTLNTTTGAWTTSATYVQSSVALFFVVAGTQINIDAFEAAYAANVRVVDIENDLVAGTGISIVTNVISATGAGMVTSVSGTANRITSTGGTTPVIDIAATYVGQTSITTLGTIATGTWSATTIGVSKGGTGLTTLGGTNRILYTSTADNITSSSTFLFDGTNFGVGATPQSLLTISKQTTIQTPVSGSTGQFVGLDANPLRITFDTHNNASASGTALMGRRSRGTSATPLALSSDDVIFSINGRGYGTTTYGAASTGLVTINAAQTFTDANQGTYVSVSTTPNNSVTAAEALRITGAGAINAFQAAGVFQINGTTVLSSSTLGSGVTASSLISVGNSIILQTPASGTLTNCTGYLGANLVLTDVTTNNASTSAHGFAPKYPNDATKYLDGTGAYTVPATTQGNLTGAITSVGLATSLGSFTSAALLAAVTDETGSGKAMFATSPDVTTSITTPSTTFALINTTATTVNFAGAAATLNIGATASTTNLLSTTVNLTGGSTTFATGTSGHNIILSPLGGATNSVGVRAERSTGLTHTSGTSSILTVGNTNFFVSSGSGIYNALNVIPSINQGGTATGTSSMINISPTVTSVTGILYGVRSQLATGPSGGGTAWNIYADGTAGNLFAGFMQITSTTDSTSGATGSIFTAGGLGVTKDIIGAANFKLTVAGGGLYVKEGTNATMGVATLVLGVATVSTTKVTANSRIFLSVESLGTIASPVAIAVTARSAGTSFTITSANLTDTSVISWIIIEPS